MRDAIRRRVRRGHVLTLWGLFALTQAVLAVNGWLQGDALPVLFGSVAVVLAVVAAAFLAIDVRITDDALIHDLVVRRRPIPWSQVERARFDPDLDRGVTALTFDLRDGRRVASPWYDRLAYPEHTDERRTLFRELERTAGRAGVELELCEP